MNAVWKFCFALNGNDFNYICNRTTNVLRFIGQHLIGKEIVIRFDSPPTIAYHLSLDMMDDDNVDPYNLPLQSLRQSLNM